MKFFILLLIAGILVLTTLSTTFSEDQVILELNQGKNEIYVEEYFYPLYANVLIESHPEIESISMDYLGETFGFVNVFGGIGTNIIINSQQTYEFYASEPVTITLK